jgi:lambda repressor-like predicted transcriptional regulator
MSQEGHRGAERVERDRRIAEAVLSGERLNVIAKREGVSRSTVKRAARAYKPAFKPLAEREETIKAIDEVDVEYLLALSFDAVAEVLKIGRKKLAETKDTHEQVAVMRAVVQAQTAFVKNALRLGLVMDAESYLLRRTLQGAVRDMGAHVSRAALEEGVSAETWNRVLDRADEYRDAVVASASGGSYPEVVNGSGHHA